MVGHNIPHESKMVPARSTRLPAPTGSSRTTPTSYHAPPIGTWRIDDWGGLYGRHIEELVSVPPEVLTPTEFGVEDNLEGRGTDSRRYEEWIREGSPSPPISVVQADNGELRITDGHRRWWAHKRLKRPIEAWVSWAVPGDSVDTQGRPIMAGLTYELADKYGMIERPRRNPIVRIEGMSEWDEGQTLDLDSLGRGQFKKAYRTKGRKPKAVVISDGDSYDHEILATLCRDYEEHAALHGRRHPAQRHVPCTKQIGWQGDKRVFEMDLYRAPLRKSDSLKAWEQYRLLKKAWQQAQDDRSSHSIYDNHELMNRTIEIFSKLPGRQRSVLDALQEIRDGVSNYGSTYLWEFTPRNLATDARGNLVLLDVFYDQQTLQRRFVNPYSRRNPGRKKSSPSSRWRHWMSRVFMDHPKLASVRLEIRDDAGDGGRHYGYCVEEAGVVVVALAPSVSKLPARTLDGLILHEIGHAYDLKYPGRTGAGRLGASLPRDPELRADAIAENLFGETVLYEPPDLVQCVGAKCRGGTRPPGLR